MRGLKGMTLCEGVRNCKISSRITKATNTNKPEGGEEPDFWQLLRGWGRGNRETPCNG